VCAGFALDEARVPDIQGPKHDKRAKTEQMALDLE
jgi:hypothetical protein